jgi:RNA polymerase sigma-70 factor (ECF subfamily)
MNAMPDAEEITQLLRAARAGNDGAMAQVISTTYQELRRIARAQMKRERSDHTLQPTALVNEACVRLLASGDSACEDRRHFLAFAAGQMRRVLLDHARARNAQKRHGEYGVRVEMMDFEAPVSLTSDEILALEEALETLAKADPRQCRIVELKYFAGLSSEEIASVLDLHVRTVRRDWVHAKATLARHLGRAGHNDAAAR